MNSCHHEPARRRNLHAHPDSERRRRGPIPGTSVISTGYRPPSKSTMAKTMAGWARAGQRVGRDGAGSMAHGNRLPPDGDWGSPLTGSQRPARLLPVLVARRRSNERAWLAGTPRRLDGQPAAPGDPSAALRPARQAGLATDRARRLRGGLAGAKEQHIRISQDDERERPGPATPSASSPHDSKAGCGTRRCREPR